MIEYNWGRARRRLLFALLLGFFSILIAHDVLPAYHLPRPCNGGLKEAIEFLIELFIAAVIIEVSSWMLWRSARKTQGGEVSKNSPIDGSKLVFAPGDSSLALLLGVALLVGARIVHLLPNPCDAAILSWREAAEYILLAYAFSVLAGILPRSSGSNEAAKS